MAWTIKSQLEYSGLTLEYLQGLPTLHQGQYDNLKIKEGDAQEGAVQVWLSSLTVEDGMPYNNQVTIETMVEGKWTIFDQYPAVELAVTKESRISWVTKE